MNSIATKIASSTLSLGVLGLVAVVPLQGGCTIVTNNGTPADAGTSDEAATTTGGDGATAAMDSGTGNAVADAAGTSLIGFTPSNINLSGIDLTKIVDEDISTHCQIRTGMGDSQDCFTSPGDGVAVQADGSKVHVIVVKSLRVEPTAHIDVISGGLPLAIISLGDMTILGPIDGHGAGSAAMAGGFATTQSNQKGAGPGGGPGATGMSLTAGAAAGGGSYCGLGGQGAVEFMVAGAAGAATASYGMPQLVPLVGGSSGGAGDLGAGAGGGALQFVARGKFMMGAGSYINVGGGGGVQGGTTGQDAGGGGSGGAILIEAKTVQIAGTLAANGGGGGGGNTGANNGHDSSPDATPAPGGPGSSSGGAGSAGATINGAAAMAPGTAGSAGAGGGGAGRIRINSMSGSADLTGATLSPSASTSCVTQGTVAP